MLGFIRRWTRPLALMVSLLVGATVGGARVRRTQGCES
jgi:hypothetical protein